MKKKFLSGLLFLSIIISGCSSDDLFSTSDVQTNQPSQEKKATTEAGTEQEKTPKTNPDGKLGSSNESPAEEEKTDSSNKPSESSKSDGGKDSSTSSPAEEEKTDPNSKPNEPSKSDDGKDSAIPSTAGEPSDADKPGSNGKTPSEGNKTPDESQPVEESSSSSFFGDNMLMTGILAALVVVILILIWMVYDRHKMKNTLNDLNNRSSKPSTPQQNMNSSSLASTVVNEQLTIRVDNFRNIGSRKEQQDDFCVSDISDKKALSEKGLMAVVADGMGGLEGGALISNLVTDTFLNNYKNQLNFEPTSFLYRTAEIAEHAVEDYMKQTGINGGSTLVAVIVKGSQMNYISVGDSHIYLLRDNKLTLINKEHNFGALLKEKADRGEIDPKEPYINPKRNALTAYIGMGSFNIVDRNANPIFLKDGDKVLLCSDGVYNALGDDALIVALAGDASTAARKLQSDILAQNIPSQDNFTAVILECVKT